MDQYRILVILAFGASILLHPAISSAQEVCAMREFPEDDVVAAVIALDDALREALNARDMDLIERCYAPGYHVTTPFNRVQTREETLEVLRTMALTQQDVERTIDAAWRVGDVVVIMGTESLTWAATGTSLDGQRTTRRFTNVWHRVNGDWQHVARHANTVVEAQAFPFGVTPPQDDP